MLELDFQTAGMRAFMKVVAGTRKIQVPMSFPSLLIDSYMIEMFRNKLLGIDNEIEKEEWPIKELVKPNGNEVFLDIGANVGQWSLWACSKTKLVVALEPNRAAFHWLRRNTRRFKNIVVLPFAAWSSSGQIDSWVELGIGSTSYTTASPRQLGIRRKRIPVKAVEIDRLVRSLRLSEGDLILKVDVEGAELEVLEGAKDTLRKARMVIVEAHEPNLERKIGWLEERLRGLGHEISVIQLPHDDTRRYVIARREELEDAVRRYPGLGKRTPKL